MYSFDWLDIVRELLSFVGVSLDSMESLFSFVSCPTLFIDELKMSCNFVPAPRGMGGQTLHTHVFLTSILSIF